MVGAGSIAVVAVLLASAERLITLSPALPTRVLVGAPLLLAVGLVVLWAAFRGRAWHDLTPAAALSLGVVSLVLTIGLPLGWLLGVSGVVGGVGPFERWLFAAAIAGLAVSSLMVLAGAGRWRLAGWLQRPALRGFATRGELVLLGVVLLLFGAVVARLIAAGAIVGFDESIYALTARWWVEGTPNTGWAAHRSPGISVLGIAALPFGTDPAPFRVIGLLFGLGALVACWRLGRELAGPAAGVLAALVVATIPDFELNAAMFLTDVPSAALMIVLMLLAWRCFESEADRPNARRAMLILAPVAAITFYVRYGASVPIAFIVIAVLICWPRRVGRWWRAVAATGALLLVLLVPHLVFATTNFGSPWAIALSARNLAAPEYLGQALHTYVRDFFSTVAAPIAGGVAVLGLAAAAWHAIATRRIDRRFKAYLFLLIPALGSGILLGLVTLAQTRYIYVPLMLLAIAGGVGLATAWRHLPAVPRIGSAVLAFVVVAIVVLNVASSMVATQAAYARTQRDVVLVADAIRADALSHDTDGDPDCSVLSYLVPEITWYSGCATYHFGYPARPGRDALLTGPNRYLVLVEGAPAIRQPEGGMLDGYLALVDPEPIAVVRDQVSGTVAARVYRFSEAPY